MYKRQAYNAAHGIVPKTIVKAIPDSIEISDKAENAKLNTRRMGKLEREAAIDLSLIHIFNAAGGVSPIVLWNNNTGKTIKYVRFYMEPYNAVDDPVEDEVTGNRIFSCKVTGPIETEKGIGEYIYDYYGVHYVQKHKDGIPYYDPSFTMYKTRQISDVYKRQTPPLPDTTPMTFLTLLLGLGASRCV